MSNKEKESEEIVINKIYLLTNKINNKVYVGQTTMPSLKDRMGHKGSGYSNSVHLFNAINKHGYENFEYTLLAETADKEEANFYECYYIDEYRSKEKGIGYNIKDGGSNGKHSKETKKKMALASKRMWANKTPEQREITLQRMSDSLKGKSTGPRSEEFKHFVSVFFTQWHKENKHPMLGKTHSEETKKLISESGKGKVHSRESIERGAEKRKFNNSFIIDDIITMYKDESNYTIDDITDKYNSSLIYRIVRRNKIPYRGNKGKWKGKNHSEDTKLKMGESAKISWKIRNLGIAHQYKDILVDVVKMYLNFSEQNEIKKIYNLSRDRFNSLIKGLKLPKRGGSKSIEFKEKFTKDCLEILENNNFEGLDEIKISLGMKGNN